MKRIVLLVFWLPLLAVAQNKPLVIEGTAPAFYLAHTVAPKENYYSIGRLYNISPKEIAPFNKLDLSKGLTLNQPIKVPLTATNFVQLNAAAADEVLIPVYHTVKEKEGLYRIATEYNKVPVATLKQWNNLSTDAVANGTKLIVGYLKVKKELSALSSQAKPVQPVAVNTSVKETVKPPAVNDTKPPVTVAPKEEKAAVAANQKNTVPDPAAVKKEVSPVTNTDNNSVAKTDNQSFAGRGFNKAVFKPDFDKQAKNSSLINETGAAAVFKSTSGWEDGKYYCLHNTATPSSIIKITSNSTGKTIYAKVLDIMPDIKQNTDLLIRISNAAAEELGVGETKFDCALSFAK